MSVEYYYTKNKDGFMGSENRKVKKKSETCEEQLRRMCKAHAEEITDKKISIDDLMESVLDIEWITFNDHKYKAARLLVAFGGPSVWINLQSLTVDGYWWGDHCKHGFVDNIGLDNYLEELHACK